MQPKNSLKASVAKAAPAKIEINKVSRSGINLYLNDTQVFNYNGGPTGNCQISAMSIKEGELFLAYLNKLEEESGLNTITTFFENLKESLRSNKYITIWTFRTKLFPEKYLELLIGTNRSNFYFKEDYFINRAKYSKLFLKN